MKGMSGGRRGGGAFGSPHSREAHHGGKVPGGPKVTQAGPGPAAMKVKPVSPIVRNGRMGGGSKA